VESDRAALPVAAAAGCQHRCTRRRGGARVKFNSAAQQQQQQQQQLPKQRGMLMLMLAECVPWYLQQPQPGPACLQDNLLVVEVNQLSQ